MVGALGFGLAALAVGARRYRRTRVTPRWRRAVATVVGADVVRVDDLMGPGRTMHRTARVVYAYEAGGRRHERLLEYPDVPAPPQGRAAPSLEARARAAYPPGRELAVAYDPARPGEAVPLEHRVDDGWATMVWGGAALFAGAALGALCVVGR